MRQVEQSEISSKESERRSPPSSSIRSSGVFLRGRSTPGVRPASVDAHRGKRYSTELLRGLFQPSVPNLPVPNPPASSASSAELTTRPERATAAPGGSAGAAAHSSRSPEPSAVAPSRLPVASRPCLELPRFDLLQLPPELQSDLRNEPPNVFAFAVPEQTKPKPRPWLALGIALGLGVAMLAALTLSLPR